MNAAVGALTLNIVNQLEQIPEAVERLEAFAAEHCVPNPAVQSLVLALDEVLTNVVSYAFEDAAEHTIRIDVALECGLIGVEVVDDGRAYDPTKAPEPNTSLPLEERPIGGLGVYLVRKLMDVFHYRREDGRNRLYFAKSLTRAGRGVAREAESGARYREA